MNGEQNEYDAQAAKQARKEMRANRDAQAIKNVTQGVATFGPGAVGGVAKGIAIADKATNNAISRGGGKIMSKVPGGDLLGVAAGNKVVTGATKVASLGKDNPSKDGFSKIKGKDIDTKSKIKGQKKTSEGTVIPDVSKSSEKEDSFFGSEFLSMLFGEMTRIKTFIIIMFIGLIGLTF